MEQSRIEREFRSGEIDYLRAIEELIELGFQPKDAEALVTEWEGSDQ